MTPEDIKRLNFIRYSSFRSFVNKPHSIIICYILFIVKGVGYYLLCNKKTKILGDVLIMAFTVNNRRAARSIIDNLSDIKLSRWENPKTDLPKGKIFLSSIKFFPIFQELYNTSSYEDKRLIRTFYDSFMATCGYCEFYDKILINSPQLKLIVFTNDHVVECRCLLEMANKYNVKTLYIQHASVTERFPPLHFTFSFLDGKESYEKYKENGDIKGDVFLTGSPRFDEMYDFKNALKTHEIGIALNMLDSCDKAIDLCKYLQKKTSKSIIVRAHPRMGRLFDAQEFVKAGMEISDPTKESSFSFLSRIKFLIANESSIHLDSVLIGTPSIMYNFSSEGIRDWYSYIRNGTIKVCGSFNEVASNLICHDCLPTERIKYYNASFQTFIEGKVGAFIANFIKVLIKKSEKDAISIITAFMDKKNGYYELKNNEYCQLS